MKVSFFAHKIIANVQGLEKQSASDYDSYAETTAFWSFIDLAGSSNYRINRGPRKGFIRGELFFDAIKATVAPVVDVEILKEMGDAVFMYCRDFTPLFETLLLIDHVFSILAANPDDLQYPLSIRAAIGHGIAKRLARDRTGSDFLGTSIDELSRLMGVRSSKTNFIIHESAYKVISNLLPDYQFVRVGEPTMLSGELSKGLANPIFYREMYIQQNELATFEQRFSYWHKTNQ